MGRVGMSKISVGVKYEEWGMWVGHEGHVQRMSRYEGTDCVCM